MSFVYGTRQISAIIRQRIKCCVLRLCFLLCTSGTAVSHSKVISTHSVVWHVSLDLSDFVVVVSTPPSVTSSFILIDYTNSWNIWFLGDFFFFLKSILLKFRSHSNPGTYLVVKSPYLITSERINEDFTNLSCVMRRLYVFVEPEN